MKKLLPLLALASLLSVSAQADEISDLKGSCEA